MLINDSCILFVFTVPESFQATVSVNETSCSLIVRCSNGSSTNGTVDCGISVRDAQASSLSAESMSTGRAQFLLMANMEYTVDASYGATDNLVKIVNNVRTGSYAV